MFSESFSKELVERIVKTQEALLRKALKLVNSGGTIIYSTCSILKEENEEILDKVKDLASIVPIEKFEDKNLKYLEGRKGTITVCPNSYYEGFFIAKLRKI